jgi:hypothetical protein
MERSLIGSYDDVRGQIWALREYAEIRSLLLKPATSDAGKAAGTLAGFAEHVRPFLPE